MSKEELAKRLEKIFKSGDFEAIIIVTIALIGLAILAVLHILAFGREDYKLDMFQKEEKRDILEIEYEEN